MSQNALVTLFIDQYTAEGQFLDFLKELSGDRVDVAIVRRSPDGPVASLDWLIPTGIALVIAKPYYETILKKMAEDHYDLLKKRTAKLWNKFFGAKQEIERVVIGPGAVIKDTVFSRDFSIIVQNVNETKITLLFLKETTPADFKLAIEGFMNLMEQHHASAGKDQFSAMLDSRELPPSNWQQLVYLNPETKQLELIDYVKSSQLKRLVSDEIRTPKK